MDLKETDILGNDIGHHWYYSSKAKAMLRMLKGTTPTIVLDVGAGSGFFSRYLLAQTNVKEAWCIDISYESDSNHRVSGKPVHFRRSIDANDSDLVLLMDVLEHVDDDVALLKEYAQKVPCGSQFLISVPAFDFLWSRHDDFLEHKRRYIIDQLEDSVVKAGLSVKSANYYFGIVFPIAATLRLAQKITSGDENARSQLVRHNFMVNMSLKFLCAMELFFMNRNRYVGLTIFCLAEKK